MVIIVTPILLLIDEAHGFQSFLLIIFRLIHGWIQASGMIPYILLVRYFEEDSPEDRCKVHAWWALASMGEIIGLGGIYLMIHKLDMSWNIAFLICLAVSGLIAILQQISVNEA